MSSQAAVAARSERGWFDRAVAAYPLVVAYVLLLMLYGWQVSKHSTPWNFIDELQWAELSRGVAHTGHPELRSHPAPFHSLYTYFLAPVWWLGSTGRAYAAAKDLNVCIVAATLFPAYALARKFVERPAALAVALATAVTPAVAYAGMLIPEPLAYFWSALVLWLVVRAALRPTRWTLTVAAVATLLAPAMREQLAVLIPTAVIVAGFAVAGSERGRRVLGAWTTRERIAFGTLLALGVVWAGALVSHHSYVWEVGTSLHHRLITYGLWAVGAYTIGVGILPVVATLAWSFGARCRTQSETVLLGLVVGTTLCFVAYAAVKASYISAQFAIRVEERNLIYLSPVAFTVTARWFARGRFHVVAWSIAVAAVAYLIATTPYHAYERLYSDAFGLAILEWLNRTFYMTNTDLERLLYAILAGSVLVAGGSHLLRRTTRTGQLRLAAPILAAAVGALAIAWNLTGEIYAANGSNAFATSMRSVLPTPPDWIDRATGRSRTLFIGKALGAGGSNVFWSIEFWNQSIGDVWSVDASVPPPGPSITPNYANVDGEVSPQPPGKYAVANPGVDIVGTLLEKPVAGLRLYRLALPMRLIDSVTGITTDGWMSNDATYTRFGAPNARAGTATVVLSRSAACGDVPATHVTVRLSTLRIDPTNEQPAGGRLLQERRFTVRSTPCDVIPVTFHVKPPFYVAVHADRTFQPSASDLRQLSVLVSFGFKPAS